jgi:hypothetical protein
LGSRSFTSKITKFNYPYFNSSLPATLGLKKDVILLDDDGKVASLWLFLLTCSLMSALPPCDLGNVELHSVLCLPTLIFECTENLVQIYHWKNTFFLVY